MRVRHSISRGSLHTFLNFAQDINTGSECNERSEVQSVTGTIAREPVNAANAMLQGLRRAQEHGKIDGKLSLKKRIIDYTNIDENRLQLHCGLGITVDHLDLIYIVDRDNHCVLCFLSEGVFLLQFGEDHLNRPNDVCFDAHNRRLIVLDSGNYRVCIFDPWLAAGKLISTFGSAAQFDHPLCLAVNGKGHIFVADFSKHHVQKFDSHGVLLQIIGVGEIYHPTGLGFLSTGEMLVAAKASKGLSVYSSEGQFLRRIGAPIFSESHHLFIDKKDNILVADGHHVRVLSSVGELLTSFNTYGKATGIAMDQKGNIFVSCDRNRVF